MKSTLIIVVATMLAGCAGLRISSLSKEVSDAAHTKDTTVDGYIVYQPMIVVEIGEKELCTKRGSEGACLNSKTVCSIGDPKLFPDYSKPFLVQSQSGLGKAGVDVKIEDGWRLGSLKDESDNTALLNVLASAGGVEVSTKSPQGDLKEVCNNSGLYQLKIKDSKMELERLLRYQQVTIPTS